MSTVIMTNPKLPGGEQAVTTQEAFDQVWEPKGFVLVTDEPAVAEEPTVEAPKFPSPPKAPVTDSKIGA